MAIDTGSAIEKFGTKDAVDDGTTSAISDGAMSAAADISAWTNDDDAPIAKLILLFQYPSGTLRGNIDVHVRPINIDGTDDSPQPTTSNKVGYAGSFEIDPDMSATTDVPYVCYVPLTPFSTKSSQEYEFYLFNDSGVQVSANWDLDVVPSALGAA
ncbi:MAG: hypothetical protein GY942_09050 [Aestuariibacter sp.]|nr:hypothetical protein [Aestuariibacter sp.]